MFFHVIHWVTTGKTEDCVFVLVAVISVVSGAPSRCAHTDVGRGCQCVRPLSSRPAGQFVCVRADGYLSSPHPPQSLLLCHPAGISRHTTLNIPESVSEEAKSLLEQVRTERAEYSQPCL